MPQAKTDTMCPQCGCTEFNPTLAGNMFRCGERVDSSLATTYTCRTVSQRMPQMEDALVQASKCLLANYRVSATVVAVAGELSRATERKPYTPKPRETATLTRFVRDSMAEKFGHRQYIPTEWGRVFLAQVLERERRITG